MQKDEFIQALIPKLKKLGWGTAAMEETSVSLRLDPNYYKIVFDGELPEIKDYYELKMDEMMMSELAGLEKPTKVREKIALALKIRASLSHDLPDLKSAWRTSDNIWRYAGDISTDFNYYTKRGLLTPVYLSAINFYKNDISENKIDTEQYISDSLEKVIKVFSIKSKLPKLEDIPILRLFF